MVVGFNFVVVVILFCFLLLLNNFQFPIHINFLLQKKKKKIEVLKDPSNEASMWGWSASLPAGPSWGEGGAKGPAGQGGRGVQPRWGLTLEVQRLICVTGQICIQMKNDRIFLFSTTFNVILHRRCHSFQPFYPCTPLAPPPTLTLPQPLPHAVWRIFITCEAGAPCLLLISGAGQWLNLLNFISGAIHFLFLLFPLCLPPHPSL